MAKLVGIDYQTASQDNNASESPIPFFSYSPNPQKGQKVIYKTKDIMNDSGSNLNIVSLDSTTSKNSN